MAKKRYIAMVETHTGNRREQWAEGVDGHSLSSSGRWTDAKLHTSKKEANDIAKKLAQGFDQSENAEAFVRTVDLDPYNSTKEKSSKPKSAQQPKPKAAAPAAKPPAPTFTVMAGRNSKTFATKAEAKAYEKACRKKTGKKYEIRTSKKKPSHKVVSFTAKSK